MVSPTASVLRVLAFLVGLFISLPVCGADATLGFQSVTALVPASNGDQSICVRAVRAITTTWGATNSELIQPIFTNNLRRSLARSATPLYIVHGHAVMPTIYRIPGDETWESQSSSGMAVTWLLGALLLVPITWATSVFWRTVDVPYAKFVRWMEERVTDV